MLHPPPWWKSSMAPSIKTTEARWALWHPVHLRVPLLASPQLPLTSSLDKSWCLPRSAVQEVHGVETKGTWPQVQQFPDFLPRAVSACRYCALGHPEDSWNWKQDMPSLPGITGREDSVRLICILSLLPGLIEVGLWEWNLVPDSSMLFLFLLLTLVSGADTCRDQTRLEAPTKGSERQGIPSAEKMRGNLSLEPRLKECCIEMDTGYLNSLWKTTELCLIPWKMRSVAQMTVGVGHGHSLLTHGLVTQHCKGSLCYSPLELKVPEKLWLVHTYSRLIRHTL